MAGDHEKTKTELTFLQKSNKQSKDKVHLLQKEVENLNSQLKQRELAVEELQRNITQVSDGLKDKENEISKALGYQLQMKMLSEAKINEAKDKVAEAKVKMLRFYDLDRFDSNFLEDATLYFGS